MIFILFLSVIDIFFPDSLLSGFCVVDRRGFDDNSNGFDFVVFVSMSFV